MVKIFLAGFLVVVLRLEGSEIVHKFAQLIHVAKQNFAKQVVFVKRSANSHCISKQSTCLLPMVVWFSYAK